jgi:type I restriction enzyme S subunit
MKIQKALHRIRPFETMNEVYLYYNLSHRAKSGHFEGLFTGSTIKHLPKEKLALVEVDVPDLPTQERIAFILSAYDDLIENNRRRIALLEHAARLLFREWFVHFHFPGHETAKFVDGLPEGWARTELSEVCSTNKASHKKGKIPDPVRYIDIGSVSTGRIDGVTEYNAEDAPGRARRIAEPMDTIWSNVRPNLQAYSLVMSPKEIDVFSTGFTVLHAETISPLFLYLTVTTDDFVKYLTNHATGASYPAVRSDDFDRAEILVPSDDLMNAFHEFAEPIFQQRQILGEHSDQLTAARDLLLPRLMDGRIPV